MPLLPRLIDGPFYFWDLVAEYLIMMTAFPWLTGCFTVIGALLLVRNVVDFLAELW